MSEKVEEKTTSTYTLHTFLYKKSMKHTIFKNDWNLRYVTVDETQFSYSAPVKDTSSIPPLTRCHLLQDFIKTSTIFQDKEGFCMHLEVMKDGKAIELLFKSSNEEEIKLWVKNLSRFNQVITPKAPNIKSVKRYSAMIHDISGVTTLSQSEFGKDFQKFLLKSFHSLDSPMSGGNIKKLINSFISAYNLLGFISSHFDSYDEVVDAKEALMIKACRNFSLEQELIPLIFSMKDPIEYGTILTLLWQNMYLLHSNSHSCQYIYTCKSCLELSDKYAEIVVQHISSHKKMSTQVMNLFLSILLGRKLSMSSVECTNATVSQPLLWKAYFMSLRNTNSPLKDQALKNAILLLYTMPSNSLGLLNFSDWVQWISVNMRKDFVRPNKTLYTYELTIIAIILYQNVKLCDPSTFRKSIVDAMYNLCVHMPGTKDYQVKLIHDILKYIFNKLIENMGNLPSVIDHKCYWNCHSLLEFVIEFVLTCSNTEEEKTPELKEVFTDQKIVNYGVHSEDNGNLYDMGILLQANYFLIKIKLNDYKLEGTGNKIVDLLLIDKVAVIQLHSLLVQIECIQLWSGSAMDVPAVCKAFMTSTKPNDRESLLHNLYAKHYKVQEELNFVSRIVRKSDRVSKIVEDYLKVGASRSDVSIQMILHKIDELQKEIRTVKLNKKEVSVEESFLTKDLMSMLVSDGMVRDTWHGELFLYILRVCGILLCSPRTGDIRKDECVLQLGPLSRPKIRSVLSLE